MWHMSGADRTPGASVLSMREVDCCATISAPRTASGSSSGSRGSNQNLALECIISVFGSVGEQHADLA